MYRVLIGVVVIVGSLVSVVAGLAVMDALDLGAFGAFIGLVVILLVTTAWTALLVYGERRWKHGGGVSDPRVYEHRFV